MPALQLLHSQARSPRLASRILSPRSTPASLARMVAVALALRLVVAVFAVSALPDPTRNFEQFGWEMGWVARSVATGHGFGSPFFPLTGPTALVPPVFPYLLAAIFRLFGLYTLSSGLAILSLNALFSALTCIPIYLLARQAANPRIASLAAWLWVVYPFSIYFSTQVWEYALTALLFTTCLFLLGRLPSLHRTSAWIGFGLLYGVTALCNPAVLTPLPFLFPITLFRYAQAGFRWKRKAVLTTLTVIAVLLPWSVRTYRTLHVIAPVRDNFWLELWAGNTGDTFESNPAWTHPASNPVEMSLFQSLGEPAYLASKHRLAVDRIARHPLAFAATSLRRAVRYWTGFWSFDRRYLKKERFDIPNLFFCTAITLFMLRGARRLWSHNRSLALPFLALLAVFPFTYYLSHSSMDYRQPIEPVILILATIGSAGLNPSRPSSTQNSGRRMPLPDASARNLV